MGVFNFALTVGGTSRQVIDTGAAPPVPFGLAPATEPSLAAFTLADAFDAGEPDLFAALRWDYGLCERLYGRDVEMQRILAWAHDERKAATARLVTGEGGAGKTRLAAEAARILRDDDWTAGFPRSGAVQCSSGSRRACF